MNKIKRNCVLTILGLFVMMVTAVSVNADDVNEVGVLDRVNINGNDYDINQTNENEPTLDEPMLISPSNNDEETTGDEPNLISPNSNDNEESLISPMGSQEASSGEDSMPIGLILIIGISGFVALVSALIIFRK